MEILIGKVFQHYFTNFMAKMLGVPMPFLSSFLLIVSVSSELDVSQDARTNTS